MFSEPTSGEEGTLEEEFKGGIGAEEVVLEDPFEELLEEALVIACVELGVEKVALL